MKKRPFLWIILLITTGSAAGWFYYQHHNHRSRHLVLITIDALRADHLRPYGYPLPHPTFEWIAKRGLVFHQAFTTIPTTSPAISSIFTSLYPRSHSVRKNGIPLPNAALTLAEIFKQNGWQTLAFVSSFPLDRRFGLHQGFDDYRDSIGTQGRAKNLKYEITAEQVNRAIKKWFSKNKVHSRLFLWVHYFDPHAPYRPPDRFSSTMSSTQNQNPDLALYDGEIAYTDEQLQVLFDILKKQRILDDSLIIITGDHGEGFGEHQHHGHGWFLYEEVIRVPLIIAGAGIQPGRISHLTSHIDLAPGILEYFGLPVPSTMQGISWWGVLQKRLSPRKAVWVERRLPPIPDGDPDSFTGETIEEKWAVRTEKVKFIWSSDGNHEYYDLAHDPGERNNLYHASDPRVEKILQMGLMQKEQSLRNALLPSRDIQQHDPETREALRALGYVN